MERQVVDQIIDRIGKNNLKNFREKLLRQEFSLELEPPTFREILFDKISIGFKSLKYYSGPVSFGTLCGLAWGVGTNALTSWPNLNDQPVTLIGLGLTGALTGIWLANEAKQTGSV